MKLALKVNGIHPKDCKLIDAGTGESVDGVSRVEWVQTATGIAELTVTFISIKVDINHDTAFRDK